MKDRWGATRSILLTALVALPLSLVPGTAQAAPVVNATLVQTIATSGFTPGSPDPAGITYLPVADRLYVADSEVEEATGAGWHNANLWRITRNGGEEVTGNTTSYTNEPTGLGFDPATDRMFVSTDSGEKVFILRPGADGRYGTTDDTRTTFLAAGFGSLDLEDVAFDTRNGHMYLADGTNTEVIDVNPVNGTFGDGDDTSTHFDVAQFGAKDSEGLGYDSVRDTLLVVDRSTDSLYEVTPSGTLVQTIVMTGISGLLNPADVEVAPSSTGSGQRTYWVVDREIDNGANVNENDGRLFEIAIPTGSDTPPSVTLLTPAQGDTVTGSVNLSANASDDNGVTKVDFLIDGTVVATDTSSAGGWTGTWNSASVADGSHTVTARATDTIGQVASDPNTVTVDNFDSPPSVTLVAPAQNAVVAGSVNLSANASDDNGVAKVDFLVDGTVVATDEDSTGGWTGTWNSASVADGSHTVTARATDTIGQVASDAHAVTSDNDTAPTVALVAPAEGDTVIGSVTLTATADDDHGVSRVEFYVDDVAVGQDVDPAGGWTYVWDSTLADDGSHAIRARAVDGSNQTADDTNTVSVDNVDEAPTVTLTVPGQGATVRGTIGLTATAGDDRQVSQVEFFVDSESVGVDTTAGDGWSASWDTTTASAGQHTVRAVATDSASQQTADDHQVTVDNDAPTAQITQPDGSVALIGSVPVTASADPDTVSVAFYRDGSTLIGSDTSSAGGWSIAWNTVGVPNGAHTLTAVATDTAGNVGPASAPVAVTIDNPLIVEVRVGSSSDDAEQKPNTNVTLASTDLDMMNDGATTLTGVGLRFTGIAVPQGATIVDAYIQFTADEVVSTTTNLAIHGQAADNAGTFTTAKNNILGRTRTGVSVGWQVDPWVSLNSAGPAERTPDLSAIVQEIVDRTGWSQGNAIAFVVTGVGRRVARAFDHTPALAPKLHIEYEL